MFVAEGDDGPGFHGGGDGECVGDGLAVESGGFAESGFAGRR